MARALPPDRHQPAIPIDDEMTFNNNRQGAVHACIYCDIEAAFDGILRVPLKGIASATEN